MPTNKKKEYLNDVIAIGKLFRGKSELMKFLNGFRITRNEAIKAKCYDCMGFYDNTQEKDCKNLTCPLYTYMPYKGK